MRRALAFLTLVLAASPALAATPAAAPSLGAARLEGPFQLAGRVTVAKLIPGERAGQTVSRTWTFNPACPAGACDTVTLVRARASGADRLLLHRRKPGYYVGDGTFFAPVRCGSQIYVKGAAVPFTITVRVTGLLAAPGVLVASRVSASYVNRSRRNLTPCVGVLGHDAATYHGHLQLGPAPSGGSGA
jgi:hypothetical protein